MDRLWVLLDIHTTSRHNFEEPICKEFCLSLYRPCFQFYNKGMRSCDNESIVDIISTAEAC